MAWSKFNFFHPETMEECISQPLWNNNFIRIDGKYVFYYSWWKERIKYIYDLIEGGKFLTFNPFQQKFNIKINVLKYNGILSAIPTNWKKNLVHDPGNFNSNFKPMNNKLKQISISENHNKIMYSSLIKKYVSIPNASMNKWETEFGEALNWETIFMCPTKCTLDTRF